MESLGDLLQQMQNPSFRQRTRNVADQVLKDPLVQEFCAAHPDVDETQLRLNMSMLFQYARDRRNCDNCPGLERCPNDFQGHFCKLGVEYPNGTAEIVDIRPHVRSRLLPNMSNGCVSELKASMWMNAHFWRDITPLKLRVKIHNACLPSHSYSVTLKKRKVRVYPKKDCIWKVRLVRVKLF